MTGNKLEALVAENIVAARRKRGWTQNEFAKKLKKPASWLSRLESGKAAPTLKTLALVSKVLRVDPWVLLADEWSQAKRSK